MKPQESLRTWFEIRCLNKSRFGDAGPFGVKAGQILTEESDHGRSPGGHSKS